MAPVVQNRDEQKRMIGEYLKAADKFIKSAEFPKALDEVNKALAIEPNNMYALAYNERIKVASEAALKKEAEERMKKTTEERKPVPPRTEQSSVQEKSAGVADAKAGSRAPDAKPQPASSATAVSPQLPADDLLAKIKKEAQDTAEKKAQERIETLKKEFSAAQQKFQTDIVDLTAKLNAVTAAKEAAEKESAALRQQPEKTNQHTAAVLPATVDHLKILFGKAWEDGVISADERALLEALKSALGISDSAFAALENETKGSLYQTALRKVWHDGVVTPEESEELARLRQKLNISAEDHFKFEADMRKETQVKK